MPGIMQDIHPGKMVRKIAERRHDHRHNRNQRDHGQNRENRKRQQDAPWLRRRLSLDPQRHRMRGHGFYFTSFSR